MINLLLIASLSLSGGVEYDCQYEFLIRIPEYSCELSNWEFWQICHQPNVKYRKRAWHRFKNNLPLTKEADKLIKFVEAASRETGFEL